MHRGVSFSVQLENDVALIAHNELCQSSEQSRHEFLPRGKIIGLRCSSVKLSKAHRVVHFIASYLTTVSNSRSIIPFWSLKGQEELTLK